MEERHKLLREMQLNKEAAAVDIQSQMDEVVRERKYSKINEDEVVSFAFCFKLLELSLFQTASSLCH